MSSADLISPDDAENASHSSSLFRDIRFWVAQRVPQRSTFIEAVRANGGRVVPLEKMADILIADHLRKDSPPNSFSYTWIEQSIAKGRLQEKENHRAGPSASAARPVGASRPAKGTRLPYSDEDDRVLYEWVMDNERRGGKILGNEIYKQLEQKNPRHPWQSWRDRWVKYVSQRPAPATTARDTAHSASPNVNAADLQVTASAPDQSPPRRAHKSPDKETEEPLPQKTPVAERRRATSLSNDSQISTIAAPEKPTVSIQLQEVPSSDADIDRIMRMKHGKSQFRRFGKPRQGQRISHTRSPAEGKPNPVPVTEEEHATYFQILLHEAESIQNVPVGRYEEAWRAWAETNPEHTAEDWREYYENRVLPCFETWEASQKETEDVDLAMKNKQSPDATSRLERVDVASPNVSLNHVPPLPHQPESGNHSNKANDTYVSSGSASTPSRRMIPVVVIPSPSQPKKVDFSDSLTQTRAAPSALNSPDGDPRKRKLATASNVSNNALNADQETSNKRQKLDNSVAESPQKASLALAGVLGTFPEIAPKTSVHVINLVDMDDDEQANGFTTDSLTQRREQSTLRHTSSFDVYESHEVPEGEEENVILKETGSPEFPTPHNHARSEEALVVFGDPPTDFFLAPTQTDFMIAPTHASSQDSWHDLPDSGNEIRDDADNQLQGDMSTEIRTMEPIDRSGKRVLESDGNEPRSIDRVLMKPYEPFEAERDNVIHLSESPLIAISPAKARLLESARKVRKAKAVKYEAKAAKMRTMEAEHGTGVFHEADDLDAIEGDSLFIPQEEGLSHATDISNDNERDRLLVSEGPDYPAHLTLDSDGILPNAAAAFSGPDGVEVIAIEDDDDEVVATWHASEGNHKSQPAPWTSSQELDGLSGHGIDHPNVFQTRPIARERLDTQTLLESDVGDFDMEVPPPPDSDVDEMDNDQAFALAQPTLAQYLDTQAVLAADTQQLELDEPPDFVIQDDEDMVLQAYLNDEPAAPALYASRSRENTPVRRSSQSSLPIDWASSPPTRLAGPLRSPPHPSTSHNHTTQQQRIPTKAPSPPDDPEEAFLARHRALGSSEQDVLYALYCTSWNSRLAAQVLQSIRQGKAMPRDVPGIWSEEEDTVLKGGDARQMKMLENRHGKRAFEERVRLLEEYATA